MAPFFKMAMVLGNLYKMASFHFILTSFKPVSTMLGMGMFHSIKPDSQYRSQSRIVNKVLVYSVEMLAVSQKIFQANAAYLEVQNI